MANRWFNQFSGSLEKGIVSVDGYVNISSAAAVVDHILKGAAVTKLGSAGDYLVMMEDQYPQLLSVQLTPFSAGTNANQVWKVKEVRQPDGTPAALGFKNIKSFVITCCNSSGVPTNPAVACGVLLHITLKNSTV